MNILRNHELDEQEFGRAAIRVQDLRAWADASRVVLPPSLPDVGEYDAVHLETLLVAFGHAAVVMPERELFVLAAGLLPQFEPNHPATRAAIEDEVYERVNAVTHYVRGCVMRMWRGKLEQAIARGDLHPFDALTGFPLGAEAAPAAGPAPGPSTSSRTHSIKSERRDEADVMIDAALEACGSEADTADVWAWLQRAADGKSSSKPGTLISIDDGALKYTKDGDPKWMNREALGKRLARRRKP